MMFKRGDYVRKKSGAFWEGDVVGDYSTDQTVDGVAVRLFGWSDGPVHIYPAAALELCDHSNRRMPPPPSSHVRGDVMHEGICNTHEGGPCNCDWSAADREGPHTDDLAVDRFAAAMKAKLAKKRDEGRGGWEDKDQCSNAFLSELLLEHVAKGDPVDVGNLAMMVHQRGESICVLTERVAATSQLHAIVDAWEALPGGRQVKNSDVERWLAKHMGPGIDAIRGFLRRPRPDGILPPSPETREVGHD